MNDLERLTGKPTEWVNDWARWRAQDDDGFWIEFQPKPYPCKKKGWKFDGEGHLNVIHPRGEVLGDWRNTLEERVMGDKNNCDMRCLHRDDPTAQNCEGCAGKKEQPKQERSAPEWDGDGLPPEKKCDGLREGELTELACLISGAPEGTTHAYRNVAGRKVVWQKSSTSNYSVPVEYIWERREQLGFDMSGYTPIRTERDKCIEAMVDMVKSKCNTGLTVWEERETIAEALYDSNLFDISLREGE